MVLDEIKCILKNDEHKACINTCSASSSSKIFLKLAMKEGIDVINIVHREELVIMLKEEFGAKYVLNSFSEGFDKELT